MGSLEQEYELPEAGRERVCSDIIRLCFSVLLHWQEAVRMKRQRAER